MTTAHTRRLGTHGPTLFPIGLGCMAMSAGTYGPADEHESIATIHAALDAGVNLIDTGDLPRFSGGNLERNQSLIDTLDRLAADKGATKTQLAIAWVLAKGATIVPLVGARTRAQIAESLGAQNVQLSAADLAQIENAIPPSAVAGTRYDERQMKILDSER